MQGALQACVDVSVSYKEVEDDEDAIDSIDHGFLWWFQDIFIVQRFGWEPTKELRPPIV